VITDGAGLASLVEQIESSERVALDTEADSLHSYREKLCLLQISVPASAAIAGIADTGLHVSLNHKTVQDVCDYVIDPLANVDLQPVRCALESREIVLHGADYDLRMLRRGLNLVASRIFDTLIASRLLGVREFSLAALVKRYFGLVLLKGSQKANWAQRPLPPRMTEYAINDVHYLLRLAGRLEEELDRCGRLDWFRQSCQRAVEQAAVARIRNQDELWRIRGSGSLDKRSAAVLRVLWQWREKEAEMADRPPFHILQNDDLLKAAVKFTAGVRRFARQHKAHCKRLNPSGRYHAAASEPDRALRLSVARKSCGANATSLLRTVGWSHRLLRREALSRRSPQTGHGPECCLFRGNASCSVFHFPQQRLQSRSHSM
jgi:ribonuclease D